MSSTQIEAAPPQPKSEGSRLQRWGFRGMIATPLLLVGILLPVWFAPQIVANTSLKDEVLAGIFEGVNGKVTVEEAELGWQTPIVLKGLKIEDPEGDEVFAAEEMVLEPDLTTILVNPQARGPIRLKNPQAFVRIGRDDCNFVNVFGEWFAKRKEKPSDGGLQIELSGGQIHVVDEVAQKQWLVNQFDVAVLPKEGDTNIKVIDATIKVAQLEFSFDFRGSYDRSTDHLVIDDVRTHCKPAGLAYQSAGQVKKLKSRPEVSLDGRWQYDLAKIAQIAEDVAGVKVTIRGRGDKPLSFSNRQLAESDDEAPAELALLKTLTASTQIGWDSAEYQGVALGKGAVDLHLKDGTLEIPRSYVPWSDGKLAVGGKLVLAGRDPKVIVPQGTIIDRARLQPEMCEHGLKFIAPVLADATDAEGWFSVDLAQCELPLSRPESGKLQGSLRVHTVQVTASPMVREIAQMLKVPGTIELVRDSSVHFRLEDERVHHYGLVFVVGGMTVQTHGSVGLDQTLDLVAETTLPADLLPNSPVGDSLKKLRLRLPIKGTLDDPDVAPPNLNDLDVKGISDVAKSALEQILEGRRNGEGPLESLLRGIGQPAPGGGLLDRLRRRREQLLNPAPPAPPEN